MTPKSITDAYPPTSENHNQLQTPEFPRTWWGPQITKNRVRQKCSIHRSAFRVHRLLCPLTTHKFAKKSAPNDQNLLAPTSAPSLQLNPVSSLPATNRSSTLRLFVASPPDFKTSQCAASALRGRGPLRKAKRPTQGWPQV